LILGYGVIYDFVIGGRITFEFLFLSTPIS